MTGEPLNGPIPRLGKNPSRLRVQGTPVFCVMAGSMIPALLPIISQSPTLPPLGLLMLVGWRLVHRDLWPLWIGAPLGAFDDLMSGNPFGSAILLWSLVLMLIEIVDERLFWRDYWHDWLIAVLACLLFLGGGLFIGRISGSITPLFMILPQLLWSTLLYPLIVRIIAATDRWRMMA